LREGHEFDTQGCACEKLEAGKKLSGQMWWCNLPNDKDVIIDSKVSLAAYERYFNNKMRICRAGHF